MEETFGMDGTAAAAAARKSMAAVSGEQGLDRNPVERESRDPDSLKPCNF